MRIERVAALLMFVATSAFAGVGARPPAPEDLAELKELAPLVVPEDEKTALRIQMVRDAALAVGTQAGHAKRSRELAEDLEKRANYFNRVYTFQALLTGNGVLPPVITEDRAAVSVGEKTMVVADRVYRIVAPARFTSTSPRWKEDYLLIGLAPIDPKRPHDSLLPKNDAERAIWKRAVEEGWDVGIRQAETILEANFARLNRDFEGMVRYSLLFEKGLVRMPVVSQSPSVVAGDENELRVGETLYRVTRPAGLETDPLAWKPVVAPSSKVGK